MATRGTPSRSSPPTGRGKPDDHIPPSHHDPDGKHRPGHGEGTLSAHHEQETVPAYTSLDTSYTEFTEIGGTQVRLYPDGVIGVTAPAGLPRRRSFPVAIT